MSRNTAATIIRAAAVVLVVASLSVFAAVMTPAGAQQATAKAAAAEALAGTLSQTGRVRVIVRLQGDFRAERDLAGSEGVESSLAVALQRAAIRQGQDRVLADLNGTSIGSITRFQFVPFMALSVDGPGLDALVRSPNVAGIQEDRFVPPTLFQSVPLIGGDVSTGFPFGASNFSGAGQMVAVLDTGVYSAHPFLAGKVLSEACYSTNDPAFAVSSLCPGGVTASTGPGSGQPCLLSIPGCDHGTHVAGIAAGKTTDIAGTLYSGVAKDASILAIQVFTRIDDDASNGFLCSSIGISSPCILATNSDLIKGLERVYALRSTFQIAAANMSLGGGFHTTYCDSDPIKAIIDQLRTAGIATVIASGNDGFEDAVGAPGCVSSAVTVGSSTKTDSVSWFSNNSFMVDFLAPGSSIGSSIPLNTYTVKDGTSMATPHVTGAFAVLKSSTPAATVSELELALRATGSIISETRLGVFFAKPRINVDLALAFVPNADGVVSDFDADTTSDVLWRHNSNGSTNIWLFSDFVKIDGAQVGQPSNVWKVEGIADFNGDGRSDILWRNSSTGSVNIWHMDGFTRGTSGTVGTVGATWIVANVGDFDGDGSADILWRNTSNGIAIVWFMNGLSRLSGASIGSATLDWEIAGVGDFGGDGKADILWRNPTTGSTIIWMMDGAVKTVQAIGNVPGDWLVEGVGDFTGEGQADILWRNAASGTTVVWQMNGFTKTAGVAIGTVGSAWEVARLADYNGGGQADILWRNPFTGGTIIWEMNGLAKVAAHPQISLTGWTVK